MKPFKPMHIEISNQTPRGIADFAVKIKCEDPVDVILSLQYVMDLSPEFKAMIGSAWRTYEDTKDFRMLEPAIIVQDFNGKTHN